MNSKPMGKPYSVEEIRQIHSKAYAPWTEEEDALLKKGYDEFVKFKTVLGHTDEMFLRDYGQRLGRKHGAIRSRIAKLLEGGVISYKFAKSKTENPTKKSTSSAFVSLQPNKLDLNPGL